MAEWGRLDSLELVLSTIEIVPDDGDLFELNESRQNTQIGLDGFQYPSNLLGLTQPFHFELKLGGSYPAFVQPPPHSSTWQGGPEAATARAKADWGNWSLQTTVDKDAYEPRWNDLTRYSLSYRRGQSHFIAGDFNATFGHQGITFWNRPVYGSTSSFMSTTGQNGFRLTPATNSVVNHALRGVAWNWKSESLQLIAMASNSKYDAILDNTGAVTRLSDGGYHRSEGESVKRETLTERLIGLGAYSTGSLGIVKLNLGLMAWQGRFSPRLQPTPTLSDPYPLNGDQAGAVGSSISGAWREVKSALEVVRNNDGEFAEAFLSSAKIPYLDTGVKLSIDHFPTRFNNLHAADVGGRTAQGFTATGISLIQPFPYRKLKNIAFTSVRIDDEIPALGDDFPVDRVENTLEGVGTFDDFGWRLRIFSRHDTKSDSGLNPVSTTRVRFYSSYNLPDWGEFSNWIESAHANSEVDEPLNSWAVAGFFRSKFQKKQCKSNVRIGLTYFETSELPIYQGEISYPDRSRIVRLEGTGIRISTELLSNPTFWSTFSIKASRTYPLRVGARGNGELYLSITINH